MSDNDTRTTHGGCARLMGGCLRSVLRFRWTVLVTALVLTGLALFGAWRMIGISTNTVDMISPDVPFRQHSMAFKQAFPHLDDTILLMIDAPTPERADIAAENMASRARGMQAVRSVFAPGTGFLRAHGLLYLQPDTLETLVDRLAAAEPLLAALAQEPHLGGLAEILTSAAAASEDRATLPGFHGLLNEMARAAEAQREGRPRKLSWQTLITGQNGEGIPVPADTARRFVVIQPEMNYTRLKPASEAIEALRSVAAQVETANDGAVTVRLTGEAVIEHQEMETVEAGGMLAGILSVVAVTVILTVGFRGPRAVAACLITLLIGLVWTAGLAAATVGTLNLISVAFAVLFVGLGIDFCIHFTLRFREETKVDRREAAIRAGRGVGCALLLSALCAALGFLSFLPTDYQGLAELGLIAGLGMAVAVVASLTVLPVLLWLFAARPRSEAAPDVAGRSEPFAIRYRRPVLVAALVAAAAAGALAPGIRFDFNPMNLRNDQASSMQAFADLTTDIETTPYVINVLAPDLATAQEIGSRFTERAGFGSVRTLASFVPAGQTDKLALLTDAAFFLAPVLSPVDGDISRKAGDTGAAYAEIRSALRTLARRENEVGKAADRVLSALSGLGGTVDLAQLSARWTAYLPRTLGFLRNALSVGKVERSDLPRELRMRWMTETGQARVTVRPPEPITSNGEIRRFARTALSVTPRATGAPVTIHEASKAVIGAFIEATGYAAMAVLLVLTATLRRARDILLALAPLALAMLLTLAMASLAGIPLNFANVIVLPLLMGLGVSSGIHLVIRARETGGVARTLSSSTPRAVMLSVLTTLASFGTLITSAHRGMSSMGALLTIATGFTLLAVLVVLPALLSAAEQVRSRRESGAR